MESLYLSTQYMLNQIKNVHNNLNNTKGAFDFEIDEKIITNRYLLTFILNYLLVFSIFTYIKNTVQII